MYVFSSASSVLHLYETSYISPAGPLLPNDHTPMADLIIETEEGHDTSLQTMV